MIGAPDDNHLTQLVAGDSRLIVHRSDDAPAAWTRIFLSTRDRVTYLGAEGWSQVSTRLLASLDPTLLKPAGAIDGQEVLGGIVLSEAHARLYVAEQSDCLLWFWQADDGELLDTQRVTEEIASEWRSALNDLR